jgi:NAD(P)-dependent dehydrogenase (short-subunit alcohol dehydrogenase family)
MTEADFHRYFNTNTLGLLMAVQEAKIFFGAEGGSIFHINCLVADSNLHNSIYYLTMKTAFDTIAQALANGLNERNIRFNPIEIVVEITDGGVEFLPEQDVIKLVEESLVEQISNNIRFWALRLESGPIRLLLRRTLRLSAPQGS